MQHLGPASHEPDEGLGILLFDTLKQCLAYPRLPLALVKMQEWRQIHFDLPIGEKKWFSGLKRSSSTGKRPKTRCIFMISRVILGVKIIHTLCFQTRILCNSIPKNIFFSAYGIYAFGSPWISMTVMAKMAIIHNKRHGNYGLKTSFLVGGFNPFEQY